MLRSENLQIAAAGTDEQTAQGSASRRGKDKGVHRGARQGGEEASLSQHELRDLKEWENRIWKCLFVSLL